MIKLAVRQCSVRSQPTSATPDSKLRMLRQWLLLAPNTLRPAKSFDAIISSDATISYSDIRSRSLLNYNSATRVQPPSSLKLRFAIIFDLIAPLYCPRDCHSSKTAPPRELMIRRRVSAARTAQRVCSFKYPTDL